MQLLVDKPGARRYWVSTDEIWTANLDGTSRRIIVTSQDVPQMMAVTPAGP